MTVHHPYNFLPVTGQANGRSVEGQDFREIREGHATSFARHDLWRPDAHSGRVVCRLHLDSPTVVGAEQVPSDPAAQDRCSKDVLQYETPGGPAVPGNSLRGMIGTAAETLSQSALRVLEDRPYSVRKPAEAALSALGLLKQAPENPEGRWFDLIPLTPPLPLFTARNGGYRLTPAWERVFAGEEALNRRLPVNIGCYRTIRIRNERGQWVERLAYRENTFLGRVSTENTGSFDGTHPVFWYARLDSTGRPAGAGGLLLRQALEHKTGDEPDALLSQAEWEGLKTDVAGTYTKGIVRILGIDGRESEIPGTKKREWFIPLPAHPKRIPIPNEAVERFRELAKARAGDSENTLPFGLRGYGGNGWEPRAGRLCFFDVRLDEDDRPVVSELSVSAIWRKRVEGTAHSFFPSDLLPWNPLRNSLTPAERLFGVVEEGKEAEAKGARNLASRLRFSDARMPPGRTASRWNQPVTLKILSSPKPPCPPMYFHPKGSRGRFVAKTELRTGTHVANGRKVYLPHRLEPSLIAPTGSPGWATADPERNAGQKLRVRPLIAGQDFFFHIDFDNLSNAELTLLLRSLVPAQGFHHRLGLGKSLGLGMVTVAVEGVFFVDRQQRYGPEALEQPRYHRVWQPVPTAPESEWRALYADEARRPATESFPDVPSGIPVEKAFFFDSSLVDEPSWQLLATVGNPENLCPGVAVANPLKTGQTDPESETFGWFGENADEWHQALPAIVPNTPLPVLKDGTL